MDHVPPAGGATGEKERSDLERNITARSTWLRFLFMVLFGVLYGLSRLVIAAVVVIQFFHVLFTGDTNGQLKTFGRSLAVYSFEVVDYLTFNTETRPFPLDADWPDDLPVREPAAASGQTDDA
jgi:hypothetical protein